MYQYGYAARFSEGLDAAILHILDSYSDIDIKKGMLNKKIPLKKHSIKCIVMK